MKLRNFVIATLSVAFATSATHAQADLVFSGVSTTSDDYALGVVWSGIAREAGVPMTVVENGTVAGMRKTAQGEIDLVGVGAPHYLDAVGGEGAYRDDPARIRERYKGMRTILAMPTGMAQYVVRADSDIREFADLDGKRVGIGRPGGNAGQISQVLFRLHGIQVSGQHLEYGPALEQIASGGLDGTLVWGGVPTASIDNASRGTRLRIVSPDPETLDAFRKEVPNGDYYVYQKVSAELIGNVYGGRVEVEGSEARFWTFPWQIMVREGVDEDTVYKITKAFWDNVARVQATSAALSLVSLDTALEGISGELHPGAARYYREIGKIE